MKGSYTLVEDETVTLDGVDFTNAILRRCKLEYHGGRLLLDGAMLLDCRLAPKDAAADMDMLYKAMFRGLYLDGYRRLTLEPDGGYVAS